MGTSQADTSLGQTRIEVHNRVEDCAVNAVHLLIDFAPLDAEGLGAGDELVGQFVN